MGFAWHQHCGLGWGGDGTLEEKDGKVMLLVVDLKHGFDGGEVRLIEEEVMAEQLI